MPSSKTAHPPISNEHKSFRATVAEYLGDSNLLKARHQFVTYSIVFLIIASVVLLIVETMPEIRTVEANRDLTRKIDYIFMSIFLIEYFLRVWSAAEGFKGKTGWAASAAYMKSLYGILDLIALVPFLVLLIDETFHSFDYLRAIRMLRLLMLARYMKSFKLFKRAVVDKHSEITISLQVITLLTLVVSVLMYEVEFLNGNKKADDILKTLKWSAAKFIHDPGNIGGDFAPETPVGQALAFTIGLLGIALFALPAGIIASGFINEMEEEKKQTKLDEKRKRLVDAFRDNKNKWLECEVPRKYVTLVQAQSRLGLFEEDIIRITDRHEERKDLPEQAKQPEGFRLRYKGANKEDVYASALIIERYSLETDYGSFEKNRDSWITVICPTGYHEPSISHFSLCLARKLEASYISNELFGEDDGVDRNASCSFSENPSFLRDDQSGLGTPIEAFKNDIRNWIREGTLVLIVRAMPDAGTSSDLMVDAESDRQHPDTQAVALTHTNGTSTIVSELLQKLVLATDEKKDVVKVGIQSRSPLDLHYFVQQSTKATVVSLYVSSDALEWWKLDEYYRLIAALGDPISGFMKARQSASLPNGLMVHVTPTSMQPTSR